MKNPQQQKQLTVIDHVRMFFNDEDANEEQLKRFNYIIHAYKLDEFGRTEKIPGKPFTDLFMFKEALDLGKLGTGGFQFMVQAFDTHGVKQGFGTVKYQLAHAEDSGLKSNVETKPQTNGHDAALQKVHELEVKMLQQQLDAQQKLIDKILQQKTAGKEEGFDKLVSSLAKLDKLRGRTTVQGNADDDEEEERELTPIEQLTSGITQGLITFFGNKFGMTQPAISEGLTEAPQEQSPTQEPTP